MNYLDYQRAQYAAQAQAYYGGLGAALGTTNTIPWGGSKPPGSWNQCDKNLIPYFNLTREQQLLLLEDV